MMEQVATTSLAIGSPFPHFNSITRFSTSTAHASHLLSFPSRPLYSFHEHRASISPKRLGRKTIAFRSRGFPSVKASMSSGSSGSAAEIAPLKFQSPIGQFLSQILTTHSHLLPAAVEQQLEQLQTQRHAEEQNQEPPSASSTDIVLYRRIAEVKANERRKVLEEILYAMVVQRFMDANVSLIPVIASPSSTNPSARVDMWTDDDGKLLQIHSSEANEMIQNHLALILGNRIGESASVAELSKLSVGQVYAASVMYGYFLRRVDERFQLEKTVRMLPDVTPTHEGEGENGGDSTFPNAPIHPEIPSMESGEGGVSPGELGLGIKPSRLRIYVMSFDGETLQRLATVRSKEAVSIIEKHTQALFGRPEIVITPQGTVDTSKDQLIKISFGGLKRLVLEAVTFGSFLWDVESYVDYRYHFVMN